MSLDALDLVAGHVIAPQRVPLGRQVVSGLNQVKRVADAHYPLQSALRAPSIIGQEVGPNGNAQTIKRGFRVLRLDVVDGLT